MRGFVPRHLVLRKRLIAHALCLARPDFKIRLGHFPFAHTGKVLFIRPLMDFPNIVVVDLLFEAFCRAYFTAGLPANKFPNFIVYPPAVSNDIRQRRALRRTFRRDVCLLRPAVTMWKNPRLVNTTVLPKLRGGGFLTKPFALVMSLPHPLLFILYYVLSCESVTESHYRECLRVPFQKKFRFYNNCWGQAHRLTPTFIIEPIFPAFPSRLLSRRQDDGVRVIVRRMAKHIVRAGNFIR